MPAYAAAIPRPPRTLTELEQATLLKVTGERRDGFRDHVIFAVALGTGLREHEIAARTSATFSTTTAACAAASPCARSSLARVARSALARGPEESSPRQCGCAAPVLEANPAPSGWSSSVLR
jgi:hypothetical protein